MSDSSDAPSRVASAETSPAELAAAARCRPPDGTSPAAVAASAASRAGTTAPCAAKISAVAGWPWVRAISSGVAPLLVLARPSAIAAAAKLGVGVDLQPAWLYLDARTLVAQFGKRRLEFFIPLKSLFEAGVIAGGGSDLMQKLGSLRSVNPYNPFQGKWVAVTRSARWHDEPIHLEQALSREQMIRFYTINNAWLMRAEDHVGSLEPGKLADLVILSDDPLEVPVDALKDIEVETTVVGGQLVHSR